MSTKIPSLRIWRQTPKKNNQRLGGGPRSNGTVGVLVQPLGSGRSLHRDDDSERTTHRPSPASCARFREEHGGEL
ncbi:MAG: hypothetical protein AAGA56_11975 [Myxococcota bacterium]